jgi:hypothetical protein
MSDDEDNPFEACMRQDEQRRGYALQLAIDSAAPDGAWDLPETLARAYAFEDFLNNGAPRRSTAAPTLH